MEDKPESKAAAAVSVKPNMLRLADKEGRSGVLLGTHCKRCGARAAGSNRHCRNCASSDTQTIELSSRGVLVNYTVVHRAASSWGGQVPYILGEVELPERVVVTSEVVDARPNEIHEGMQMELTTRVGGRTENGEPIVVYKWVPSGAKHEK